MTVKGQVILAREVQVGDLIVLKGHLGSRVVLEVQQFDEDTGPAPGPRILIIYGLGRSLAYQGSNRHAKGARSVAQPEGSYKPLKPDDEITIEPSERALEPSELVAIERRD